jgi:hypothetical protein
VPRVRPLQGRHGFRGRIRRLHPRLFAAPRFAGRVLSDVKVLFGPPSRHPEVASETDDVMDSQSSCGVRLRARSR